MVGSSEGDLSLLILLLVFSAFFSGTEAAYLAVSRTSVRQMREQRRFGSMLLALQHRHRPLIISSLLLGITMSNYMAERIATGLSVHFLGPQYGPVFGPLVAIITMTTVIIVFCEVVPIQIGAAAPDNISRVSSVLVTPFVVLLMPVTLVISFVSRGLLWLGGVRTRNMLPGISEDHLKAMIEQSEEQGMLQAGERRMMHGVLDFADRTAAQLMTPRPDMVCVAADAPLASALEVGLHHHHSRLPVFEENSDNIVGVLHLKDLLPYLIKGEMDREARVVARCAHHVPEAIPADELLRQLQKRSQMLAIVKDEYGGTAGLVTVEDVLEEIVGEIVDEYDVEEPEIVQSSETELLCEARIGLHQLEDYVHDDLPTEDYDSLGGLILDLAGRIPAVGDQFQWHDLVFTVESITGPRIERIRVTLPLPRLTWQEEYGGGDE
ncbi:MAG: hemolysin family protein [Armatimonadota bacterium]